MGLRTTTAPRHGGLATWALLALALALLLSLVAGFFMEQAAPPAAVSSAGAGECIAYLEFGRGADSLWLADPARPADRVLIRRIDHAPDFGALAALAPGAGSLAYTLLPPDTVAPAPDALAELWVAPLAGDGKPRFLAGGVDLLVPPVWSADGATVVFRRSRPEFQIAGIDLASGAERTLVASAGAALFPVAFAPDGRLLYVALDGNGSRLFAAADGRSELIAPLADALTRDWSLSPAGDRLAYLELTFTATELSSRARILDLATGRIGAAAGAAGDEFNPVWRDDGSLAVGRLAPGEAGVAVSAADGSLKTIETPGIGFEVPLAWSGDGYLALRRFQGSSAVDPGRSDVLLLDAAGNRTALAAGELTVLGWLAR